MSKKKVAIAMSGGVDSTVAAYLAQRAGYEVYGIYLRMEQDAAADVELLRSCEELGIELLEYDCAANFYEKVLYPSALEYNSGRTPNPCCQCNKVLKFAELLEAADKLGVETVWTGHYVRLICEDGIFRLAKGTDSGKDQSYFLYRLTQKELSRIGFPLGEMSKAEVRQIAADAGLPCAVRKDSQDACFQIAGECCGETLRRRCQLPVKGGWFLHNGKRVGRHNGIHRYTLGQRQGLNVALGVPAYVRSISAETGNIELTTDQNELMSSSFTVKAVSWQSGNGIPAGDLTVRVRYRFPGVGCTLKELPDGRLEVYPDCPQRAVTPGQAAVFYIGEYIAGGGIIENV
jgi:tRNA-specific 2-thiouridylase